MRGLIQRVRAAVTPRPSAPAPASHDERRAEVEARLDAYDRAHPVNRCSECGWVGPVALWLRGGGPFCPRCTGAHVTYHPESA